MLLTTTRPETSHLETAEEAQFLIPMAVFLAFGILAAPITLIAIPALLEIR